MQSVFIIGYPRSGTTLLLHLLLSTKRFPVYDFDETHFFSHYFRRYGNLTRRSNMFRFKQSLSQSEWFCSSGMSVDSLPDRVGRGECGYSRAFVSAMGAMAESQGFLQWIEKTPWHMLYIREIKQAIPNAKFILIVRDPRDVALSINQYGWNKGLIKGVLRNAISWRWHMKRALRDLGDYPEDSYMVRYEDILLDPANVSKEISAFLKQPLNLYLDDSQSRWVTNKPNSSYANGGGEVIPLQRWKSIKDKGLLGDMEYILNESLQKFRYESSNTQARHKLKMDTMIFLYGLIKGARQLLFPLVRK